jgi:hypothetical protein
MWKQLVRQTNRRVVVGIAAVVVIGVLGTSGWLIYHFGTPGSASDG